MLLKNKEFLWVEKYRPHKIADCILPDDIKKIFQEFVAKGSIPNMTLAGAPGMGKTTVALAMCEELDTDYIMLNGSTDNGINMVRYDIQQFATTVSFTGKRKVIIIDEADNLTPDALEALRGVIEKVSSNCSFILTCNFKGKVAGPNGSIASRCPPIDFKFKAADKAKLALTFHKRLKDILTKENIKVEDDKILIEIIMKHFPDYRRILGECQKYSVSGEINVGILTNFNEEEIKKLLGHLKDKNFTEARKWIAKNNDFDATKFFRQLFDIFVAEMKPESLPQAVILLGDYQFKSAFVADQEINAIACLTDIMGNCEFK